MQECAIWMIWKNCLAISSRTWTTFAIMLALVDSSSAERLKIQTLSSYYTWSFSWRLSNKYDCQVKMVIGSEQMAIFSWDVKSRYLIESFACWSQWVWCSILVGKTSSLSNLCRNYDRDSSSLYGFLEWGSVTAGGRFWYHVTLCHNLTPRLYRLKNAKTETYLVPTNSIVVESEAHWILTFTLALLFND